MAEKAKKSSICGKNFCLQRFIVMQQLLLLWWFFVDILHHFKLGKQEASVFLTQTLYTWEDDCFAWLFLSDKLPPYRRNLVNKCDSIRQLSPYHMILVACELTSQTTCPLIRWNCFLGWFFTDNLYLVAGSLFHLIGFVKEALSISRFHVFCFIRQQTKPKNCF